MAGLNIFFSIVVGFYVMRTRTTTSCCSEAFWMSKAKYTVVLKTSKIVNKQSNNDFQDVLSFCFNNSGVEYNR